MHPDVVARCQQPERLCSLSAQKQTLTKVASFLHLKQFHTEDIAALFWPALSSAVDPFTVHIIKKQHTQRGNSSDTDGVPAPYRGGSTYTRPDRLPLVKALAQLDKASLATILSPWIINRIGHVSSSVRSDPILLKGLQYFGNYRAVQENKFNPCVEATSTQRCVGENQHILCQPFSPSIPVCH